MGSPRCSPACQPAHHAFAVYAEVCRLAGGFEEGAPAQLQATGRGRGRGATAASGAPPAPSPRGDMANKDVATPAAKTAAAASVSGMRRQPPWCWGLCEMGAATVPSWVGLEPGGEPWGPPPLKPQPTGVLAGYLPCRPGGGAPACPYEIVCAHRLRAVGMARPRPPPLADIMPALCRLSPVHL